MASQHPESRWYDSEAPADELARDYLRRWRKTAEAQVKGTLRSRRPFLNAAMLTERPIDIEYAMHLVNTVAWCYFVRPMDAHDITTSVANTKQYLADRREWIEEAFSIWKTFFPEKDMLDDADVDLPFGYIELGDADATRANEWIGLGQTAASTCIDMVATVREHHLDTLVYRNDVIFDLMVERTGEDEHLGQLGERPWMPGDEYWPQENWPYLLLYPTCHAVMLLVSTQQLATKKVMLVLTGHDKHIRSGAPTFDDIPSSLVLKHHGPRAVEVTLSTAIWFLGGLKIAETSANNELTNTLTTRKAVWRKKARVRAEKEAAKTCPP